MRKTLATLGTASLILLFSTSAFARAWNVPANVRIVQKSNIDTNGRIYPTIQAAINSISNPSATNPHVIKVMPGTYNERVTLQPGITLEGSGAENTIISDAATIADGYECDTATLDMAADSAVKNLTVKRTFDSAGWTDVSVNAISVKNVTATVDEVTADATATNASQANGICIVGDAGDLHVADSTIMATTNTYGQANAVYAAGGALGGALKMTALRTRFVGANNGPETWGDVVNFEQTGAYAEIRDSIIEDVGVTTTYILNSGSGARMRISNSKIVGPCKITTTPEDPTSMIIATSMITGGNEPGCQSYGTPKFVNNFDENGNPIPNQ